MAPERKLSSNSKYLRIFFILAAFEGLVALIYLLVLPRDPGGTILGYSAARMAMAGAALVIGAAFTVLSVKVPSRMADRLFEQRHMILNIVYGVLSACLLLGGWLLIFHIDALLQLNEAHLARLAPFIIWGILLVLQAIGLWIWRWNKPHFSLPSYSLDAVLLVTLWAISLASRAMITGYGLPYQAIWDEPVTYVQSINMLTTPGLHPSGEVPGYGRNAYGDLPVYITTAGEVIGLMEGFRSQEITELKAYVSPPAGVATIYQAVNESGLPLQVPRLLFALINSLAPVMIYLLLRRFLAIDPWTSFGAALLMAFLSREVLYYSSYILPDALAATLFIGMLIATWLAIKRPSQRRLAWLASGILGGMIVSVNIRSVTVVILPFIALIVAEWGSHGTTRVTEGDHANLQPAQPEHEYTSRNVKTILISACAVIVGLVAGFVLTSPYALLDLPGYTAKWTSFSWYHVLGWKHRLESIAFYLQGMFMPGFGDVYIASSAGSIGFGLPAGILSAIGLAGMIKRYWRYTIPLLVFGLFQLYMISPIVQRYTRHAFLLYPLVVIAAGMGLYMIVQAAQEAWRRIGLLADNDRDRIHHAIPIILLAIFLLIYSGQIRLVGRFINRIVDYQPAQVQAAEYLQATLKPGEKVGILDIVPWVESDLNRRKIPFVRVGLHDTLQQWQELGLSYVVGTDKLQADFGSAEGTLWAQASGLPRIAEFGVSAMIYAGYPSDNLYLFVARLPGTQASVDAASGGTR